MLPTKLLKHEHEKELLDIDAHAPLFKHGFDKHALVWQVLPKKPDGHEHENVLLEREMHTPLFKHGFGIQRFV